MTCWLGVFHSSLSGQASGIVEREMDYWKEDTPKHVKYLWKWSLKHAFEKGYDKKFALMDTNQLSAYLLNLEHRLRFILTEAHVAMCEIDKQTEIGVGKSNDSVDFKQDAAIQIWFGWAMLQQKQNKKYVNEEFYANVYSPDETSPVFWKINEYKRLAEDFEILVSEQK